MAHKKTLTLAVGGAFAASLAAAPLANAAQNPFHMESLDNGYQVAAADQAKEGADGDKAQAGGGDKAKEGKCGEGKCGEGQCGANMKKKSKEGACGGDKAKEGACGGNK